ncbi:hypothetical protein L210DRAFT_3172512 [Boletus edulis BED1]|uniref:Uncharacterized protein n=1 Tax=Boletus edulis BED1 TaxID=1328754 RepID=A0AAD4BYF8_BOLED|nr:hypothetical protein L210DRAFT_3172512 [Boletus edulis BED1]
MELGPRSKPDTIMNDGSERRLCLLRRYIHGWQQYRSGDIVGRGVRRNAETRRQIFAQTKYSRSRLLARLSSNLQLWTSKVNQFSGGPRNFFYDKPTADLNSGHQNTSEKPLPIIFPRIFGLAKFLDHSSDILGVVRRLV